MNTDNVKGATVQDWIDALEKLPRDTVIVVDSEKFGIIPFQSVPNASEVFWCTYVPRAGERGFYAVQETDNDGVPLLETDDPLPFRAISIVSF